MYGTVRMWVDSLSPAHHEIGGSRVFHKVADRRTQHIGQRLERLDRRCGIRALDLADMHVCSPDLFRRPGKRLDAVPWVASLRQPVLCWSRITTEVV